MGTVMPVFRLDVASMTARRSLLSGATLSVFLCASSVIP